MIATMVELDGAQGEGGGQILRTALSLSMITGRPFRIERIRSRRSRPGLLRQHLTAVQAAAEICGAEVSGAELGALDLSFKPGRIRGGDYRFAIGTAGSCTLVLQTIVPALWFADGASSVLIAGGTHNPTAPPADFLIRCWLPLLRGMGVDMEIELLRHGFYPAGGGEIRVGVRPVGDWQGLDLEARGALREARATAVVAGLSADIAHRELERVAAQLGGIEREMRVLPAAQGPGNVVLVEMAYERVTEVFVGFGEKGVPAESVADGAARAARRFNQGAAAVGEFLADQLLLPMALAGKGCFTTGQLSSHLKTNVEVIERFLDVRFQIDEGPGSARVSLSAG
ncbi:MAG TPA: RNA 3'-terminal phosphate cyclase [Azonexus sp.]|nr:RNA 3'-terminal phosphate cyclase [Azonexus sp.]